MKLFWNIIAMIGLFLLGVMFVASSYFALTPVAISKLNEDQLTWGWIVGIMFTIVGVMMSDSA